MNERLSKIINHPMRVPIATGVVSFGVGMGLGYFLGLRKIKTEGYVVGEQLNFEFDASDLAKELTAKQRLEALEKKLEDAYPGITDLDKEFIVDEQIEQDNEEHTPEEPPDVEEFVAEKLKEAIVSHQLEEVEEAEVVAKSVFAKNDDDWNYEEEVKHRSSEAPYVIHKDEFWAEEMDYTQITLSYYEGDNIMADEDDTPVYNYETVTGPLKFGHGSGDPNVFHVRNDKRRAEYEILYHPGLFSEEVLGLEIENNDRVKNRELKHSSVGKFKLE